MKERTKDLIEKIAIPVVLALALVAVSIWGATQAALAKTYQNSTESMYRRAFSELTNTFSDLTTTLGKLMVVNSPTQSVLLLDDIWRLSGTGVGLMSQVPQSHLDTESLNRFIVQLGDYAHALSKNAVQGKSMTDEDYTQLQSLYDTCSRISAELSQRLADGDVPVAVITNDGYYTESNVDQSENEYEEDNKEGKGEFPTLIYDGPFADSVEKQEARGLTGDTVDEARAQQIAEAAAGIAMTAQGMSDGKIPCYDFSGQKEDGRTVDISITQQGGHILWLMSSATGSAEGIPEESEAERYRDKAIAYLEEMGFGEMQATYAQYYGGCALINCAAVQDDAILYNDLVKVWIDRETLEIVGVDARNWLFSHTERTLETPEVTMEDAEAMLSGNLTVENRALALIPLTPEREVLCYEFKCTRDTTEYIVYINVVTGDEEQIFQIINSEDGQMVI